MVDIVIQKVDLVNLCGLSCHHLLTINFARVCTFRSNEPHYFIPFTKIVHSRIADEIALQFTKKVEYNKSIILTSMDRTSPIIIKETL